MIAIPDEKWAERPLGCVVLKPGRRRRRRTSCASSSRRSFAKWWLPERFEFVDEIPKTSVGKFRKTALREQFAAEPRCRMRAAVLARGRRAVRARATCPIPTADGKVVVRVRAAGVNFADVLVRRGRYPQMPELPAVLGSEIAGELEDGTRVMAITSGARRLCGARRRRRAQVVPLPEHASFAEGASFLLTFLTRVHPADAAGARRATGRRCSCMRRAGGVGTAAIQVARALGARVVAAVGSPEKLDVVPRARRRGGIRLRRAARGPAASTSSSTRSAASCSRRRSRGCKPLGVLRRDRLRGGRVAGRRPGAPRRPQRRRVRLLPRPAAAPRARARRHARSASCSGSGRRARSSRSSAPSCRSTRSSSAHELVESRKSVGKVVLVP